MRYLRYLVLRSVYFSVLPHWGESSFEEITEQTAAVYEGQLKLLKLTNQQAVLVNDNKYTVENN
ncbi:hypothetical protein ACVRWL_02035 [Streptococcus ratti]|uniref:hypothetical protein n=1 Tax=Streptococcus ratti TaxID=1341 RepID=UPI001FE78674|nr:hypothetical protein [Streptococcus ratti]